MTGATRDKPFLLRLSHARPSALSAYRLLRLKLVRTIVNGFPSSSSLGCEGSSLGAAWLRHLAAAVPWGTVGWYQQ
eukprot:5399406-Amphidinium_carterae.1